MMMGSWIYLIVFVWVLKVTSQNMGHFIPHYEFSLAYFCCL